MVKGAVPSGACPDEDGWPVPAGSEGCGANDHSHGARTDAARHAFNPRWQQTPAIAYGAQATLWYVQLVERFVPGMVIE
jgi:hypothetical protein